VVWPSENGDIFYNCPSAFIPQNVFEWYEIYQYEKEFGTDILYDDRSNKYLEALYEFRGFVKQVLKEKEKPTKGFSDLG